MKYSSRVTRQKKKKVQNSVHAMLLFAVKDVLMRVPHLFAPV